MAPAIVVPPPTPATNSRRFGPLSVKSGILVSVEWVMGGVLSTRKKGDTPPVDCAPIFMSQNRGLSPIFPNFYERYLSNMALPISDEPGQIPCRFPASSV